MSFATVGIEHGAELMPSLDIAPTWISVAPETMSEDANHYRQDGKKLYFYNGKRPASGTFMTEDDGVSPRVTAWAQFKH